MKTKLKRTECDSFLQGYLDAALFTTDTEAPGGCDYISCGRADDMYASLPDWFIEQARKDCASFCVQNCALLNQAGDPWQNGADFWYTRNGHGVGFWDRGYDEAISKPLTKAASMFREHDLCAEDLGLKPE